MIPPPLFYMLNCLRNKVSWWDGCGTKPDALLLNSLRGFDISFADYVTGDQRKTAAEVLDTCIDHGAQRVEDEMRLFISPNQTAVTAFRNKTLGQPSGNLKERPQDGKLYGLRIDLCRAPYLALQLNVLYFYPKTDGSGTVRVFDLLTGTEKLAQDVTFIGGEVNAITLDKVLSFDNHGINVMVTMETDVTVYDVQPWERSCTSCGDGCRYFGDWMYAGAVKIDRSKSKIAQNVQGASHTGGIYLNYNLTCDISDYLCGASTGLKLAVWYAAGSAAMDEILFSDRINSATTVRRENAAELKNIYEGEYARHMGQVTGGTETPRTPCFVCNTQVKQKTMIP